MKPVIGITSNYLKDDRFGYDAGIGGHGQSWHALANDYVSAVRQAGGIPVILPVTDDEDAVKDYLDALDGIIISGGSDISPLFSGQEMVKAVGEVCHERDFQEFALVRDVLDRDGFPVLGICRGCQIINVALGGTLILDMDAVKTGDHFFMNQRMDIPSHFIETAKGSLIEKILGEEKRVNSYHHQCIDKLGEGLVTTAFDSHNVPECLELPKRKGFTLAVQWHPEGLACRYPAHGRIFSTLTEAATEYASRRCR